MWGSLSWGRSSMMKVCVQCEVEKPVVDFNTNKGRPHSYCRACHVARSTAWNSDHAEECRKRSREKYERRKQNDPMYLRRVKLRQFNLTLEQYNQMFLDQGGGCAICEDEPQLGRALCVDHDHVCCQTNNGCCGDCVRGLLCDRCNRLLGQARDNQNLLQAAARYLGAHCALPE